MKILTKTYLITHKNRLYCCAITSLLVCLLSPIMQATAKGKWKSWEETWKSSGTLNISNTPLYLGKIEGVPPYIMFNFDDSGSMSLNVMPDDHYYNHFTRYDSQIKPGKRNYVMSPMFNTLYYNDQLQYKPRVPIRQEDVASNATPQSYYKIFGEYCYPSTRPCYYYQTVDFSSDVIVDTSQLVLYHEGNPVYDLRFRLEGNEIYYGDRVEPTAWSFENGVKQRVSCPWWSLENTCTESYAMTIQEYFQKLADSKPNYTKGNQYYIKPDKDPIPLMTDQQLVNFANWYKWYRYRIDAGKTAIGLALEGMPDDYFVGLTTINRSSPLVGLAPFDANHRERFYKELYDIRANGLTPLRGSTKRVGEYFNKFKHETDYFTDENGQKKPISCRERYHILMSDGVWSNDDYSYISSIRDSDGDGIGDTSRDGYEPTLADVANYYHKNEPKMVTHTLGFGLPSLNMSQKPAKNAWFNKNGDPETNKIYDLWHAADNTEGEFLIATDPISLSNAIKSILSGIVETTASSSAISIDNNNISSGQAKMFFCHYFSGDWSGDCKAYEIESDGTPKSTSLWSAAEKMKSPERRNIYTSFNNKGISFDWRTLNSTSALPLLQTVIRTLRLESSDLSFGNILVDYIRGSAAFENEDYWHYTFKSRTRTRNGQAPLGDIITSSIQYSAIPSDTTYVGANDGMLHAFDANTGEELFAYIPKAVQGKLIDYATTDGHVFMVDGTPTITTIETDQATQSHKTVLVSGLNAGGQGVFALDISDTTHFDSPSKLVMWDFSDEDDPDLGYTYSTPQVVTFSNGQVGALIGNGYNSDEPDNHVGDGTAKLFAIFFDDTKGKIAVTTTQADEKNDLFTSTSSNLQNWSALSSKEKRKALKTLSTPEKGSQNFSLSSTFGTLPTNTQIAGRALSNNKYVKIPTDNVNKNGLSTPIAIDIDGDGEVEIAYAGDLQGRIWKFDISDPDPSQWHVAGQVNNPQPLYTPLSGQLGAQPITAQPTVLDHKIKGRMVLVGTGRYVDISDPNLLRENAFLGIWDTDKKLEITRQDLQHQYIKDQVKVDGNREARVVTSNSVNWANAESGSTSLTSTVSSGLNSESGYYGWYLPLLLYRDNGKGQLVPTELTGERVTTAAVIRDGTLYFNSFIPNKTKVGNPCETGSGGNGFLMVLDGLRGSRKTGATIDITGNNTMAVDGNVSNSATASNASGISTLVGIPTKPTFVQIDENTSRALISGSNASIDQLVVTDFDAQPGRHSWRRLHIDIKADESSTTGTDSSVSPAPGNSNNNRGKKNAF